MNGKKRPVTFGELDIGDRFLFKSSAHGVVGYCVKISARRYQVEISGAICAGKKNDSIMAGVIGRPRITKNGIEPVIVYLDKEDKELLIKVVMSMDISQAEFMRRLFAKWRADQDV